jgi:leucyl-tRNA synthetase
MVPNGAEKELIEETARSHAAIERFLEGRPVKRVIVVPGRLVNVVG